LGTEHDHDVGNRVTEHLNRLYGDPKFLGAVHPHRAPGFENRKPEHRREDGSYPTVRLITAERRECAKTLELSQYFDEAFQHQATLTARSESSPVLTAPRGSAVEAYRRHYRDVLWRLKEENGDNRALDLSRVDSMVAVRMRVTGHDQADIEAAIRQCAPAMRPAAEGRDWDDYARRTARFAYSAAGDRQVKALSIYQESWLRLEGREPERQRQQTPEERRKTIFDEEMRAAEAQFAQARSSEEREAVEAAARMRAADRWRAEGIAPQEPRPSRRRDHDEHWEPPVPRL